MKKRTEKPPMIRIVQIADGYGEMEPQYRLELDGLDHFCLHDNITVNPFARKIGPSAPLGYRDAKRYAESAQDMARAAGYGEVPIVRT